MTRRDYGPGGGITVSFSLERLGHKIDIAQDVLDAQIWSDMSQYMPMRTGALIEETAIWNQSTRGEVYLYPPDSDYGHYQYIGYKYVDPVYGIGAFYSEDYGFWSRPGIPKEQTWIPLKYSRQGATARWDETAKANHLESWVRVARRAVQ